jgi:metallo-beta-lactamase family protein
MAHHTLGRRILELGRKRDSRKKKTSPPLVKILGKEYPLRARVRELGGFSAHADQRELLEFLRRSRLDIRKIALVHGEKDQMIPFKKILERRGYPVVIPRFGQKVGI